MKKRVLIPLLLACLLAALLPVSALADTANNVSYYSWNDSTKQLELQTCSAATVVSSGDNTWGDDGNGGWYVVNSNVTFNSRITVTGEVHLILADGKTLTAEVGVRVADDDNDCTNGSPNALTIYGQTAGTGGLTVPDPVLDLKERMKYHAAIGGNKGEVAERGGTVTINGGNINVRGWFGAGIGGSSGSPGGGGGTVTINGGTVSAKTWYGAGIGGGYSSVTTSNTGGDGGVVTIRGGTITASSASGMGIGRGDFGISSATFQTTSDGNAVIFASSIQDKSKKTEWKGVIFEGDNGKVYGKVVTPIESFTIPSGKTLLIESGKNLTISNGVTLTNYGKIYMVGGSFTGNADNLYYSITTHRSTADNLDSYNDRNFGKAGSEITLTPDAPTQIGTEHSGWSVDPRQLNLQIVDNKFTMPKSALNIIALYDYIDYTVIFDSNGGSAVANKTVHWDDRLLDGVANPTRSGWTFAGWTFEGKPVKASYKYNYFIASDSVKSITLTAQWTDATVPVISGIVDGKTYCSAQTVTVTDNVGIASVTVDGAPVTLDSNGRLTLAATNSEQTIVAKDAAGNQTQMSVTVNDGHRGGMATCVNQAVCMYCSEAYTGTDDTNHVNLEHVPASDATVTQPGNIEYWYCGDCHKCFSDKQGKNIIPQEQTILKKLPPEIIEGMGQSILAGEKKALSFTSNAAFKDFIRVELDGKPLSAKNYTAKEGSTIVTLTAEYVATLAVGEHTIGIVSDSGTAETTFAVNPRLPQTGDNSRLTLWMALLLVSGGLLTAVCIRKRSAR